MDTNYATWGVVISVQGQNPGPASGITYTVTVNLPTGTTATYSGVRPHNYRQPDTIDTVAAASGSGFVAFSIGGVFQYQIIESFATEGCP
jgi:hypothetical protein